MQVQGQAKAASPAAHALRERRDSAMCDMWSEQCALLRRRAETLDETDTPLPVGHDL
jgi:hypothetical protein